MNRFEFGDVNKIIKIL